MKRWIFLLALLVLCWQTAWPQVKAGTVIFVDFAKDEITVASDSRTILPEIEGHDDTECKISAFGDKFIFALAGMAKKNDPGGWNGHLIARKIWESESASKTDAAELVLSVSEKWTIAMDEIYGNPEIVRTKRHYQPDNAIFANSFFAATDKTGKLVVRGVDISFDLPLFDSTGKIRLIHTPNAVREGGSGSAGHDEIIGEFMSQSTPRAAEFMRWWVPQISTFSRSAKRAAVASKLIELSILLHAHQEELGFPIDVVQLRPRAGVHWVSNNKNCPDIPKSNTATANSK